MPSKARRTRLRFQTTPMRDFAAVPVCRCAGREYAALSRPDRNRSMNNSSAGIGAVNGRRTGYIPIRRSPMARCRRECCCLQPPVEMIHNSTRVKLPPCGRAQNLYRWRRGQIPISRPRSGWKNAPSTRPTAADRAVTVMRRRKWKTRLVWPVPSFLRFQDKQRPARSRAMFHRAQVARSGRCRCLAGNGSEAIPVCPSKQTPPAPFARCRFFPSLRCAPGTPSPSRDGKIYEWPVHSCLDVSFCGDHKMSSTFGRAPKYSGRKSFSRPASSPDISVVVMKKSAPPVSCPGCQ